MGRVYKCDRCKKVINGDFDDLGFKIKISPTDKRCGFELKGVGVKIGIGKKKYVVCFECMSKFSEQFIKLPYIGFDTSWKKL